MDVSGEQNIIIDNIKQRFEMHTTIEQMKLRVYHNASNSLRQLFQNTINQHELN